MADVRPIGAVRGADKCIEVEWTLDTVAYASGDLMALPVKLEGAAFVGPQSGITTLMSVVLIDTDAQGQYVTIVFADREPQDLGALNAAPTLSDAYAADARGFVQVTTWEDCGVWSLGCEDGLGLTMQADANGDLWAWLLSKGTGTYASGKLHGVLCFIRS